MPGTALAWMTALLGRGPVWGLLPISEALFTLDVPGCQHFIAHTHHTHEAPCSLERLLHYNTRDHRTRRGQRFSLLVVPDPLCLINEPFLRMEEGSPQEGSWQGRREELVTVPWPTLGI